MNAFSASLSRAASQVSWWKGANATGPDLEEERAIRIDAEEMSDHMLRDIGIVDGRPIRGERRDFDDLDALFQIGPKRFL